MSKVRIELNAQGVRELLKSGEVAAECEEQAKAIAGRAGDGYEIEPRNYPERSGYAVIAATTEARKDNLKNNTLLKASGK